MVRLTERTPPIYSLICPRSEKSEKTRNWKTRNCDISLGDIVGVCTVQLSQSVECVPRVVSQTMNASFSVHSDALEKLTPTTAVIVAKVLWSFAAHHWPQHRNTEIRHKRDSTHLVRLISWMFICLISFSSFDPLLPSHAPFPLHPLTLSLPSLPSFMSSSSSPFFYSPPLSWRIIFTRAQA